jgi:hypothetical protein
MSISKNELSAYASVNYIWTLAVLSTDEVNTASYLNSVPNTVILRSGGYTKKTSITTNIESEVGVNVEYFIDDIHIDSIYSPNPKTGVTNATKIDFKITEPYSVGLFLQTLTIAAMENGYSANGYGNVPILLRCEFIGYDSSGNVLEMITRDIALRLVNVSFTVDAGGSIYQVEAIVWSQQALGDDVQITKTDSKFYGNTVEEILSVGSRSLVAYLNNAEQDLVNQETKPYPNEYLIEFPDKLGNYIPTPSSYGPGTVTPGSLPAVPAYGPGTLPAGGMPAANLSQTSSNTSSEPRMVNRWDTKQRRIDSILRDYGFSPQTEMQVGNTSVTGVSTPSQKIVATPSGSVAGAPRAGINAIGNSVLNTNLNYMGNQEFALDSFALDPKTRTYSNNLLTLNLDRTFSFKQGARIEDVITQVILTSDFTRNVIAALETNVDKPLTWFRIETETLMMNAQGQMKYIYKVIPYLVDRSLFEKNGVPKSYNNILSGVAKGYNYVYTGLNTEVLNFDISINSAFFQMLTPGINNPNTQTPTASGSTTRDILNVSSIFANAGISQQVDAASGANVNTLAPSREEQQYTSTIVNGPMGSGLIDTKAFVAQQFQNIILNSNVELVNIQLEIIGDPYFMPDSGMGNQVTNRGMSYQQGEIDVIINFNTPVDYKDGIMAFSTLDSFIGLYKIVKVTHTFQNGQFKQTLDMIRRPNQDTNTLAAAKALLIENAIGQQIPNLQEIILSGAKNTAPLIYGMLMNPTGLSSFISKVLAFQNIENLLPMPKDLLSAFGSITQFGASITSISTSLQSLYGGSSENLVKNFSTNLVKSMTSNLQNTISSITKPFSQFSTTLESFATSLVNPNTFASQIDKNTSLTPSQILAQAMADAEARKDAAVASIGTEFTKPPSPKIPPGDPTKLGPF